MLYVGFTVKAKLAFDKSAVIVSIAKNVFRTSISGTKGARYLPI